MSELIAQDCEIESERVAEMTGAQIRAEYARKVTERSYAYIDNSGHLSFMEKTDANSNPADEWESVGYLTKLG